MKSIIDNLREYQIHNSLTAVEIAGLLGVETNILASWFDGDSGPDSNERYRILKLTEDEYHININD